MSIVSWLDYKQLKCLSVGIYILIMVQPHNKIQCEPFKNMKLFIGNMEVFYGEI
jgi:hypothetical protein